MSKTILFASFITDVFEMFGNVVGFLVEEALYLCIAVVLLVVIALVYSRGTDIIKKIIDLFRKGGDAEKDKRNKEKNKRK